MDEILGMLGSAVSAIAGGAFTGLFGVAVQRYFDLKKYALDTENNKLKYAHEENLRRLDADIMREEWASRTKIAEVEIDPGIPCSVLSTMLQKRIYFNNTVKFPSESGLSKIVCVHIVWVKLCCALKSPVHIGMFRTNNDVVMKFFNDCSEIKKDFDHRHLCHQKAMISGEYLKKLRVWEVTKFHLYRSLLKEI